MPADPAEVKSWLIKARHDWLMAEAGLSQDPPITDASAFHCQQAAEKLLKAYLVFREHPFEKIHDLRVLAQSCARLDDQFTALIPELADLTTYAIRFRYPGPPDPTVDEVRAALSLVQRVWQIVASLLPPECVTP